MFNQRQLEILLELCENCDRYMTASYFAKKQQVSLRTVQNDIKHIKEDLSSYSCLAFQSVAPKGSRILVKDLTEFSALKETLYQQFSNTSMNYQTERINQLLLLLLNQHRAISLYDIETSIYVSRSTLLNDLKRVSDVLRAYNLELLRSSNKVVVDGSEVNKRMCLSEENLLIANASAIFSGKNDLDSMTKIKDILVETFVSFKHTISEVELNNAIVLLYVALRRMQDWFFISPTDLEITESLYPEREMAESIFKRIGEEFFIRIPQEEIDYFALYMKGQGKYSTSSVISQEIDSFILEALGELRNKFGIDLTNDLSLRIALALHCTPLIVRMKYDMQLKNHLVDYIRQTFPQGFDMAIYFASCMQRAYHKQVSNEEIAFIAIHFYNALMERQRNEGTRRVMVISSLRRSENLLLRQSLTSWFADQISELAFVSPADMTESLLSEYDIFVTTEKGKYYDMGLAFYISQFPDQQDYLNLKLAMDGFESIDDILQIFQRDLFVTFEGAQRDEILKKLCDNATNFYHLEGLYDAVLERETMASTFFGNGIAAPHPMTAVSSETFVSVGISSQGVTWDCDHNQVNLVILVGIGKNNPKAFQLWNYLSKLFGDRHFAERLTPNPSYENFIKLLKDTIADNFKI